MTFRIYCSAFGGAKLELREEGTIVCDMPDVNHSGKPFYRRVQLCERDRQRVLVGLSEREHLFIGKVFIPFDGRGSSLFLRAGMSSLVGLTVFCVVGSEREGQLRAYEP
jgi:hypothetical protein